MIRRGKWKELKGKENSVEQCGRKVSFFFSYHSGSLFTHTHMLTLQIEPQVIHLSFARKIMHYIYVIPYAPLCLMFISWIDRGFNKKDKAEEKDLKNAACSECSHPMPHMLPMQKERAKSTLATSPADRQKTPFFHQRIPEYDRRCSKWACFIVMLNKIRGRGGNKGGLGCET